MGIDNIPNEKFEFVYNDNSLEKIEKTHIGYWEDVWRRYKQNKIAFVALIILVLLVSLIILGPILSPYSFDTMNISERNKFPSKDHIFGTDELGRDVFTRVCKGGRISLEIGLFGALIATIIGSLYGAISAYFGGKVDNIMMRITEVILCVPYLLVVILISIILQYGNLTSILISLTITSWCNMARIVRGQMLQLKSLEFITAAEALGVSSFKIILNHLIPNTLGIIIVSITFDIPLFIFSEAFLSFIGLGVQPPDTSWGALASSAQANFMFYPYQLFFPSIMIALTMLSFTLIGDGLRDALDPKLRK